MKQYLDLLKTVLDNGETREDRTGTGTISLFGTQTRYNLNDGFPALTTKKLAWKPVVAELLWFIEGSTDERRLAEIQYGTRSSDKKTIWTANAEADYWKPKAQYDGDVGVIYGSMWRNWITKEGNIIDQLQDLINGIKTNPTSRRHILSAWNPGELDNMALPPCHVMSQFYVSGNGNLSCILTQRSCDLFLGCGFNIASYSLLTHMIAQVCGLGVGEFIHNIADAHIYLNHIDQVKEQLSREPMPLPRLELNRSVMDITEFTMDDIQLVDYVSHPTIKAPMAV